MHQFLHSYPDKKKKRKKKKKKTKKKTTKKKTKQKNNKKFPKWGDKTLNSYLTFVDKHRKSMREKKYRV